LFIFSLLIMSFIVFFFDKFREDRLIYYLTFGMVVGQTFFPVWFFQGMEKMKYITFLNIVAKTIFTISIFVFVRKISDYLYVPLLNSLGFVFAGVLSLIIIFRDFDIKFKIPSFESIKYHLKEGWYIFVSTVAASSYTMGIPFLTGLLTDNVIVGYYVAGEKIIRALEGLLVPLSQTLYPYISKKTQESKMLALRFIKKYVNVLGVFTFIFSLTIVFFAPQLCNFILGNQFIKSIIVVRILAFLLFVKGVGHIFLLQTMLNFGHSKEVFKIVLISALISIFSGLILIPLFLHRGSAISALLPEVYMLISSALFVERRYHIFRGFLIKIKIRGTKNV